MWHSEANLGTWMNIPGLLIAVPSNSYDAAGLLKTAWATDDPVLFCESVALYNRRDWEGVPLETPVPDIDELIPFGVARTYNEEATDVGVITFGATVPMARKAARDCGKVLIVTEDRFWGGIGPTISSIITRDDGLFSLEAPVKMVTAIDSRVAYGLDGDGICLPTVEKITAALDELHNKY